MLLGGPAGAGKSTLAAAWCATRARAAHVELDDIRSLIVSGLADPQQAGSLQDEQYALSVAATCALVRTFVAAGYDVAIDDVLEPDVFSRDWQPQLGDVAWKLVILLPSLEETLARSGRRDKDVLAEHTRRQHERCAAWPAELRVDTTGLDVEQSLSLLLDYLA